MDDTVNGWIVTRKIFMEKVEIKIEVTIFYAENAPKTISRLLFNILEMARNIANAFKKLF